MNDELERLMREATPGPWKLDGDKASPDISGPAGWAVALGECSQNCGYIHWNNLADADLIVAAVNALPELLAERAENARLREALQPFIRSEDDFKGAPDNAPYGVYVKIGDLRRARAALNQETKP